MHVEQCIWKISNSETREWEEEIFQDDIKIWQIYLCSTVSWNYMWNFPFKRGKKFLFFFFFVLSCLCCYYKEISHFQPYKIPGIFFQSEMCDIFIEFNLSQYLITTTHSCWTEPAGNHQNWPELVFIFIITTYAHSFWCIQFQLSNWKISKEKIILLENFTYR